MKLSKLRPGTFFEFDQPGYCFGRCLWLGVDKFKQLNFVYRSASRARFIHNEVQGEDPEVNPNVDQSWD